MNQTEADPWASADRKTTDKLAKMVKIYGAKKLFLEKRVASQKGWDTYPTQVNALFPLDNDRDPSVEDGSSFGMAHDLEKEKLVWELITRLRVWLDKAGGGRDWSRLSFHKRYDS